MITSTDGQTPYNALIAAATTGRPINQSTELALTSLDEVEAAEGEFNLFGEDGFSFADLVDVVNPLQHIPVVSTMYREASEDTLAPGPRMLGSTLFFGPIGLATSVVNVLIEQGTGKDVGEHIASALFSDGEDTQDDIEIADIAAFNTAAGTDEASDTPKGYEQIDPVSAWAANEVAWQREQQGIKRDSVKLTEKPTTQDLPDATTFFNSSYDQLAATPALQSVQTTRNAAWAYESAAGLALDRA